jgi:hypothetical protein
MVMFYFNEGKEISRLETKYSNKTKIREIIFDAYFDDNWDIISSAYLMYHIRFYNDRNSK